MRWLLLLALSLPGLHSYRESGCWTISDHQPPQLIVPMQCGQGKAVWLDENFVGAGKEQIIGYPTWQKCERLEDGVPTNCSNLPGFEEDLVTFSAANNDPGLHRFFSRCSGAGIMVIYPSVLQIAKQDGASCYEFGVAW